MDKITKILAITTDRSIKGQGSGGNCKVVSLLRDGNIINDEEKILEYIETRGMIFSNKLYDFVSDLHVNELIEIIPSYINTEITDGRNFYVSINSVKKVGSPVIDIPLEYLSADYIDLDLILKYLIERHLIPKNFNHIYLCDHKSIFGPFKITDNSITPLKGRHSYSFEYNVDELIIDDLLNYSFLLNEPKTKIKSIDCSTPAQLIDFLKQRLSVDRADLNLLAKIGKEIYETNSGALELDAIRLNRGSKYVNQLTLSFNELQSILEKKDDWIAVVEGVVNNYKNAFKDFALLDINKTIDENENELKRKKSQLADLDKIILEKQEIVAQLSNDIDNIELRKDELILNIKLLAGLNESSATNKPLEDEMTFEVFLNQNNAIHNNIDDFYEELKEKHKISISNKSTYEDGLFKLKENNFLVANCTGYVLNLVSHLGKSEVLIQNTEPDWLKFVYWKKNGLELFVNKAADNPETKYFYILQDFNLASFECYGKPVIDISNKIRKSLFNNNQSYPSNLFIILVRTNVEIEEFGFDINKTTFKNWSFLPNISAVTKIDFPQCSGVKLDELVVNRNTKEYSEHYF